MQLALRVGILLRQQNSFEGLPQGNIRVPQVRFADLIANIRTEHQHYVDSQTWEDDWTESWVSFSDVLGFGARCLKSEPTTVNTIVRFHRCVGAAGSALADEEVRLFRFTDAVYALSPSLETVLRFSSTLQHQCLAHNSILLADKEHPLAHHLLLLRTTVAHGRTLTLPDPPPPQSRTLGVDSTSLLAGAGIVRAYNLEKSTVGGVISISEDDRDRLVDEGLTVRGHTGRPRTLVQSWVKGGKAFSHDGVIDFPWPLLRPLQSQSELWVDSTDEAKNKLKVIVEACDLLSGEFLMAQAPLAVAKHRAGLMRHANEVTQRLNNHENLRRWDDLELRAALGF